MRRKICALCKELRWCEDDPRDCERNNKIYNLVNQDLTEIIEDFHRVLTEIESDGDE